MTKNNNLLLDYMIFSPNIIIEQVGTKKKLIVSGILQSANIKNNNGRIYPKYILERELNLYSQKIKERRALGELDHPADSIINLANVSHIILDAHWNDNNIMGKIEILETPAGNILKSLFEANIQVGISSRGVGTVKESNTGISEVQDDFQLIGWDFVSDPSTNGAFMYRLNESKIIDPKLVCKNKIECLIYDIIKELK